MLINITKVVIGDNMTKKGNSRTVFAKIQFYVIFIFTLFVMFIGYKNYYNSDFWSINIYHFLTLVIAVYIVFLYNHKYSKFEKMKFLCIDTLSKIIIDVENVSQNLNSNSLRIEMKSLDNLVQFLFKFDNLCIKDDTEYINNQFYALHLVIESHNYNITNISEDSKDDLQNILENIINNARNTHFKLLTST